MVFSPTFLKQFLRHPTRVGAITPSGPALVREMVDGFDWNHVDAAIEYGPGTGVFTEAIGQRLDAGTKFFAIERSESLVELCRRRCPTLDICHGDVCDVRRLCDGRGIDQVQAIVCGLPWASFGDSLQQSILDEMFRVLPVGGHFATFAYVQGMPLPAARQFSRRLRDRFSSVTKSRIVWRNVPPAIIYRCVR